MSTRDEINLLRKVFLDANVQKLEDLDERIRDPQITPKYRESLLRERRELLYSTQERGGILDRLEVLND